MWRSARKNHKTKWEGGGSQSWRFSASPPQTRRREWSPTAWGSTLQARPIEVHKCKMSSQGVFMSRFSMSRFSRSEIYRKSTFKIRDAVTRASMTGICCFRCNKRVRLSLTLRLICGYFGSLSMILSKYLS